jgi:hypothetical protein
MFDSNDHLVVESGNVPVRRGGGWTVVRVGRMAYRRVMVNFAKYVVIEFLNREGWDVEEVVDEWLNQAPLLTRPPTPLSAPLPSASPQKKSDLGGE